MPPAEPETEPSASIPAQDSLIPRNPTWDYPLTLNFRPGDGLAAKVNPPRFSWRYLSEVQIPEPEKATVPLKTFRFQVANRPDFASPVVDVTTQWNFYNQLAPLASGTWYWRIARDGEKNAPEKWSAVRRFSVSDDTPQWDRSVIKSTAEKVGQIARPRFGPKDGNWTALKEAIEQDDVQKKLLRNLMRKAHDATRAKWWNKLPDTDVPKTNVWNLNRRDRLEFAYMAEGIANTAFAYRLTGDEKFAACKDMLVDFTKYKLGGLSSPEWHGNPHKFAVEIPKFLTLAYDWLYDDLSDSERAKIREAIDWRLDAIFFAGKSWETDGKMDPLGMAQKNASHPYQNTCWTMPALLGLAGESESADKILPMVLNWLTGVSASQGPEEAYNEGQGYGTEKGGTYLESLLYAHLVAPELELGKNPQLRGLGDWYAQVIPLGATRLPWGDQWPSMVLMKQHQMMNAWMLAWLTQEPRYAYRAKGFQQWKFRGGWTSQHRHTWLPLLAFNRLSLPEANGEEEKTSQAFRVAGWAFAGNQRPSDAEKMKDAIQLQMQARPKGKTGHSYCSDGAFVWNAFGQTLSTGGDNHKFMNSYCHATMAHNGILLNGEGQDYKYNQLYAEPEQPPYMARLLAWEEGDGYVYWAADLTNCYFKHPGVKRIIRHVVFADNRWHAIYDDIAYTGEGKDDKPANASFLFKVPERVPVEISETDGSFTFSVKDTQAKVVFANDSDTLSIVNQDGRAGYVNPITGFDFGPIVQKRMQRLAKTSQKGQMDPEADFLKQIPIWNNLWITRDFANQQNHFLAALLAWKDGEAEPAVEKLSPRALLVTWPEGKTVSVSFDPDTPGDIWIDTAKVAVYQQQTSETQPAPNTQPIAHNP